VKIGIVGAGLVGSTAAYALVLRGIGSEIVLVDRNEARARAEAADILHAVPFARAIRVEAGGYPELRSARIVILSAGVAQRPGETRLQLLERNAAVFEDVVPRVLERAPEAVLVVATNPVDVMTHLAARFAARAGVPSTRVIGTGTMLDTARFRALLGACLGVDPHHVHGYVVGEHGDSEVLTWSLVKIGGNPLEEFCRLRGISLEWKERQAVDRDVREAAYRILAGKGATYYGIGAALARLVQVILTDQRAILTVCTPSPESDEWPGVTLSLPRLVGGQGVLATLPLLLDTSEQEALRKSAQVIREAIGSLSGP